MNKAVYSTWYEFKKDLQNRAGHVILNEEWLRIKPREPLPWDESSMRLSLSKYLRNEILSGFRVR